MKKLLIIEDDRALGDGLCMALRSPELELTLCHTLSAAGAALEKSAFDLLLLDVNLPDGSGLDLLRQVRRSGTTPAWPWRSGMRRRAGCLSWRRTTPAALTL